MMLFLFKYIDDLIGKGFEWYIIVELLWYASATNVAMALPLAVLLSSIMTFGSLGENYELVAIKSAGISLQKAMSPLIILITLLGTGAFLFSDYMLPKANLKMLSLLYDVRNQKADFLIEEGIFNNSIPGYAIRVQKKDPDGQTLHGVLIYDQTGNAGGMTVLMAKEGIKYISNDKQFLVLKLKDGVRYEEAQGNQGKGNKREIFRRYRFKETEQTFDLSAFKFQRTDENLFKSNYQMLSLRQLSYYRDSLQLRADSNRTTIFTKIKSRYKYFLSLPRDQTISGKTKNYDQVTDLFRDYDRRNATFNANETTRQIIESLKNSASEYNLYLEPVWKVSIEYQRKFTLSVACLLLFSIGAPLGAIIRKGGLGLPVVMSILFFLIYHIISTISEKAAREGSISPGLGMWSAIIILAPVGIFLTYKATVDSTLFNIDQYKQLIQKLFTKKKV
ncbi:MAG TPA: permease [Sphingobacteriaceae bacterium]|nr:permease [Sphingobacteriaceae bacterium]